VSGFRLVWLGTTAIGLVMICATSRTVAAQTAESAPVQLPTVSVEGQPSGATDYNADQSSLHKLTEPLRDTPQTITVIPKQIMQDQGVTTLRDALRNVTGISLNAGEASRQGDSLTIRGFTASNDIYLDGMNDFGSYYRDPFNLEQIEVLTGPSSVLFGRGSTGGVVNQSSKTPFLDSYKAGTLSLGTDMTKRVTADVNTPLDGFGPGAAFRINLMAHNSEVTDRDHAENSRFGIAPTIAFGLGTDTRTTLSYLHQSEYDTPDYGLPWLDRAGSTIATPAPVPRANFYGFDSSDYLRTNADVITGKIEHDVSDAITLRDQLRFANYLRDFRITEPIISSTNNTTAQLVPAGTPLSALTVFRNEITGSSAETFLEDQADMTSRFHTWFVDHTLVTGVEIGRQTSDPSRYTYSGVPTTNLLTPNPDQPFTGTANLTSQVGTTAYTQGVYAIDTLKLDSHWDIVGAVRFDRFDAETHQNIANGATQPIFSFRHVDEMPSYRAAVVYKPVHEGTLYAQYGTSFDPSAETLSLTSATGPLPPVKNRTYEAGTKWDLLGERLSLNGSVFRIEQYNARETDPNNSLNVVLAGDIVVDGFSLGGSGHLTDRWQVFAGYTYLDGEVVSSPFSDKGNRPANTPRNTFTLWSTYDVTPRVQVGAGPTFVADRFASSNVDALGERRVAPAYWTGQAMVKYRVSDNVDLQLNVYNIANSTYFDQVHPNHVPPAAGRTALLTTSFRF